MLKQITFFQQSIGVIC